MKEEAKEEEEIDDDNVDKKHKEEEDKETKAKTKEEKNKDDTRDDEDDEDTNLDKPPNPIEIDFDGIAERAVALPLPLGRYSDLVAIRHDRFMVVKYPTISSGEVNLTNSEDDLDQEARRFAHFIRRSRSIGTSARF